jgi:hypothetical protein
MQRSVDIHILILEGSPRQRGQTHGESLKPLIHEHIDRWKHNIQTDLGMDPDVYLTQFIEETNFLPAIRRWTPDLLEEVEGIAEGAGLDFDTVFARQLSDEEPWFRLEKKLERSWGAPEQCTAVGVDSQGEMPAIVAQNMDTPSYYDGYQVLLHIKHPNSDLEAFVFTIAGKISLAGMNNAPFGICCNTVLQLDYAKDGLPEDFIVRGALAQPSFEESLAFLRQVKHASGQNYVIGGPERVLSLECSANKIVEFTPYPGANRVYHTNHPIVNDDQEIHRQRLAAMTSAQREALETAYTGYKRFQTMERHLGDPEELITIDKIKTALSSHDGPVCIDDPKKITLGCLIMELSSNPTLQLASGPPCSTPFKTYTFV